MPCRSQGYTTSHFADWKAEAMEWRFVETISLNSFGHGIAALGSSMAFLCIDTPELVRRTCPPAARY
jgi:hypothetical protein